MILKIAYNDDSQEMVNELSELIFKQYPLIEVNTFHEQIYKERKKAFELKSTWGTRLSPFAILIDEKPICAFYSEENKCNKEQILETISEHYKE